MPDVLESTPDELRDDLQSPDWQRRLVYVVNRRTVVDQTTVEVEKYKKNRLREIPDFAISTLRGQFADNRQWSEEIASQHSICVGPLPCGSALYF